MDEIKVQLNEIIFQNKINLNLNKQLNDLKNEFIVLNRTKLNLLKKNLYLKDQIHVLETKLKK